MTTNDTDNTFNYGDSTTIKTAQTNSDDTQNLTEQWKAGELPSRDDEHIWLSYYIKHNDGYIHADSYWRGKWGIADRNSISEILAPVPTYNEYLESEAHCAVYSEENKRLKEENKKLCLCNQEVADVNCELNEKLQAKDSELKRLKRLENKYKNIKVNGNYPDKISRLKSRIKMLTEERKNLRELLKECLIYIPYSYPQFQTEKRIDLDSAKLDILTRINAAIGESEE